MTNKNVPPLAACAHCESLCLTFDPFLPEEVKGSTVHSRRADGRFLLKAEPRPAR